MEFKRVKFSVKAEEKMVKAIVTDEFNQTFIEAAKCDVNDTFDEEAGKRLAMAKATKSAATACVAACDAAIDEVESYIRSMKDEIECLKTAIHMANKDKVELLADRAEFVAAKEEANAEIRKFNPDFTFTTTAERKEKARVKRMANGN